MGKIRKDEKFLDEYQKRVFLRQVLFLQAFTMVDEDKDGYVTIEEMKAFLKKHSKMPQVQHLYYIKFSCFHRFLKEKLEIIC